MVVEAALLQGLVLGAVHPVGYIQAALAAEGLAVVLQLAVRAALAAAVEAQTQRRAATEALREAAEVAFRALLWAVKASRCSFGRRAFK
jgi:hypothetical protein